MNAYYRLYIKSVIRLAATILIKDAYTATAINALLKIKGYAVDDNDPYSWKYYLNLAGIYHESDTPMTVTSLDTLEEIPFTKETLAIHRGTKKEYYYGSRYYQQLVAQYPDQRALINGILNPVDVETAIAAGDHTILFYDTSLVEAAEQQLIPGLQAYIDHMFVRWYNPDYTLFEQYYYPGFLTVLYSSLVMQIILLRKRACKTDQAHSYHIRQYLTSNSEVGEEFDYMTQKQRLWLYRNIRYLNRNLGRQDIFEGVTQKVLTDRGFSLVGYDLTQNYENMPDDLTPTIEMVRTPINGIAPAMGGRVKTLDEAFDMELPLARDNPEFRDENLDHTRQAMTHSLWSQVPTKMLESNTLDRTDAEPFTLSDVLLNHWLYLSHFDRYTTVVTFTNPANGDVYRLSAKNAFIFYLYAYNKSIDIELPTVPILSANRVRRIPLPTWTELRNLAEPKRVPDYYIDYILDTQVDIGSYVSVDAFREMCVAVQEVMLRHRAMRHYNPDYRAEGQLHTVIDHCYQDIRIDLAGEMPYDAWLESMEIDTSSMGRLEYDQIAATILATVTGADLTLANSARAIHAAMLRIMKTLSSYTVQYIQTINDSPLKIIDGKFPKLTIPDIEGYQLTQVENPGPTILDVEAHHTVATEVQMPTHVMGVKAKAETIRQWIPVKADVTLLHSTKKTLPIESPMPRVRLLRKPVVDLSTIQQAPDDYYGYEPVIHDDFDGWITGTELAGYETLTDARRRLLLGV